MAVSNKNRIFAPLEPAKPLNDAQMCGSFFVNEDMNSKTPFTKPYTKPADLVNLLQSRGLSIADVSKAESYIRHDTAAMGFPKEWYNEPVWHF